MSAVPQNHRSFGKVGRSQPAIVHAQPSATSRKWIEEPVPLIQLVVFMMAFLLY